MGRQSDDRKGGVACWSEPGAGGVEKSAGQRASSQLLVSLASRTVHRPGPGTIRLRLRGLRASATVKGERQSAAPQETGVAAALQTFDGQRNHCSTIVVTH